MKYVSKHLDQFVKTRLLIRLLLCLSLISVIASPPIFRAHSVAQELDEAVRQASSMTLPGRITGSVKDGNRAVYEFVDSKGRKYKIEDLFKFAIPAGSSKLVEIKLTSTNPAVNLDLLLFKQQPNGLLPLAVSNSKTEMERLIPALTLEPGTYLIGVSAITGSSDYIIETKVSNNRLLRMTSSSTAPNSTVTIPLSLVSEGGENRLAFSLKYDPLILSHPQFLPGSDATAATFNLNTSKTEQGQIGLEIALPAGQKFDSGIRELLKVIFAVNDQAKVNATTVDFSDHPVVRSIIDLNGETVIAGYHPGTVILVPGLEADVSPRRAGDNKITLADWIQIGRFVIGLDTPADDSEFQRADCAPKSTRGDGQLNIADWVMAGRYAAGLEPPVPAGGPTALVDRPAAVTANQRSKIALEADRVVRVAETVFQRGLNNEARVELVSQGDEHAISFSLNFDVTQLNFVSASLGDDAPGAILNVNNSKMDEGRIGIALALPDIQTFTAGDRQIVKLTFKALPSSSVNSTTLSFGDSPVASQIVDAMAIGLPADYTPGVITINPPVDLTPTLTSLDPNTVIIGGPSITLTVNGTNFVDGAIVLVNGSPRATTFISRTQLRATMLVQDLSKIKPINITVQNPPPEGIVSNALSLSLINPVPTLASISPSLVGAGERGFTMSVTGANFVPGATVQLNGSNRATTFVSSTQLSAQILDSDLAVAGAAVIRVVNPEPGGGISNTLELGINTPNPLPRITGLSPESVIAGSPGFTLAINGSSFVNNSVVRLNSISMTTRFINSTQLTVAIPAELIASPGTVSVRVFNPAPGGGNSNSVSLAITVPPNPVPIISALSPSTVNAGGPQFTLIVQGQKFLSTSVVRFEGEDRPTTFVSATELRAEISANDIQNGGNARIRVFNPSPGGGLSNELTLTINFAAPMITALSPISAVFGGPAFTLTVFGTNFAPGSVVRWNGANRPTTSDGVTVLNAQIPATDIVNVGAATITVLSPIQGGIESNSMIFSINQAARPLPRITTIAPNSALVGSAALILTVNGTNFVSDSVVRWNNSPRPTTFVNSTRLTAQISAQDLASVGTASVTVFTPPAGGGQSNAAIFTIGEPPNAVPAIANIDPGTVIVGGGTFSLIVNGSGFNSMSIVQLNGSNRPTVFVNANQLTALISAVDIAVAGVAKIRVVNPPPDGGTSNEIKLAINNPAPSITSINPTVIAEGGPGVTLVVNGTNFVSGAGVLINGLQRVTTFVSSTQLKAQVLASDIAVVAQLSVQVVNPPPGGGNSNTVTLEVKKQNPLPRILSLSPDTVNSGGPTFVLTVNGANFVSTSIVRVNGQDRPSSFVSETVLSAQIPASDIAVTGTMTITVSSPAPGGNSNPLPLAVVNATPRLTSLSPTSVPAGSPAFILTVNGEGFISTSVVRFNGVDVPTTFVTNSRLSAQIPTGALIAGGAVPIVAVNPAPGGGVSNALTFAINHPVPAITSLSPDQTLVGAPLTLTVNGSRFVNGARVLINGQERQTTFVSGTQLTAAILAADLAQGGAANITVVNPTPGGGTSNAAVLTINNRVPTLTSLSPVSVTQGSAGFMLTINGTGFVSGSAAQWNSAPRQTTFVSGTQLTIQVTAGDVANVGTVSIVVVNPTPGGGTSNALTFTINTQPNPVPTLTSLNPGSIQAGSSAFNLTVNGAGFVPGAAVRWNGNPRQTTFVGPTQLTAQIPATDLLNVGSATITVVNPAPGGGTSGPLTFTIAKPNPSPTLGSLNPNSIPVGSSAFIMSVNGTNFVNGAVVQWNGNARQTTFVSSTQLTAQIPATDVASTGSATITVANPAPGGGTSNALPFTIGPPNPVPALTSLSPNSAVGGSQALTLTVNGTNFVNGAVVRWNGGARQTAFVSSTQLKAQITAADLATMGTANVTAINPAPGGGTSGTLTFTITAPPPPPPIVTDLSPASVTEGGEAFTLTVTGNNFVTGMIVRWNGGARQTTFVSSTQLTAQILKTDIPTAGTANITVFNPTGSVQSNNLTFTIKPLLLECTTICLQSAAYFSLNKNRWPRGSVIIGGTNFNKPILIQNNMVAVSNALAGGYDPLQKLNQQFVAMQLSVLSSGFQPSSERLRSSRLICYGRTFNPAPLSNGITITTNTSFGDLMDQTLLAIIEGRTQDMIKLTAILNLLNGDDPSGICR